MFRKQHDVTQGQKSSQTQQVKLKHQRHSNLHKVKLRQEKAIHLVQNLSQYRGQ